MNEQNIPKACVYTTNRTMQKKKLTVSDDLGLRSLVIRKKIQTKSATSIVATRPKINPMPQVCSEGKTESQTDFGSFPSIAAPLLRKRKIAKKVPPLP